MSQLALYLLGPPCLEIDGGAVAVNRRKVLGLLVYLALTRQTHRRDHLATLFWPGYDQTSARSNLRRALSSLKRTLTGDWLQVDREQVSLRWADNFWLDVDQFHQHLISCTRHGHPAGQVCDDCLEPLSQAAALYQDDLLTGFTLPDSPEFDDWQLFQTESLRRELAEALEKLVHGHSAKNEFEPAITCARRWLALDPLQEAAHCHLMRLLTLSGERNAALTQYESCRQILADELGVEPTAETTGLYEQIRAGVLSRGAEEQRSKGEIFSASFWSSRPVAVRHNLPAQLTPFIGRVKELAEITRLIRDEPSCRLLTLVGSGGSGKTRLAIRAAEETREAFQHGGYFVPLASIRRVEPLVTTIAGTLDFPLSGADKPKDQLLNYLREQEMLLVLDNFEQLIPKQGTELLLEILKRAPQVKLLVTSRERLNLQPEWGVDVHGLRFPTADQAELSQLETYDAVQLFLQQARRARPGFTLSRENALDIMCICRLVEGMPLGLELAASWLRLMACREISREIEGSLDFLTTSLRDLPERHQSLRAVFEHSWQLLTEKEKVVFRKLSVFHGGFRRRAAKRVADASLPLLSALVDKSLLRRTRAGRYEIHELLRQYAAEKLNETPGESEVVRGQHSEYYLTFLEQRTDDLKGKQQKEVVAEIVADIDNIRAGWQRAVAQRNVASLGKAANSLLDICRQRGWSQEGEVAFRQAVKSLTEVQEEEWKQGNESEDDSAEAQLLERNDKSKIRNRKSKIVLAQLLRGQGLLSAWLGFIEPGLDLLQQSVSLLRRAEGGLQPELAHSLHELAFTYWLQGRYSEAKRHFQESLAIYTKAGDRSGIGRTLLNLGSVATYQGEYAEANQLLQESRRLLKQIHNRVVLPYVLNFLAIVARSQGEYEQAERFLTESLQISHPEPYTLRELGYLAIVRGNYRQAKTRLQECLAIFQDSGLRTASVFPLDGLGAVARLRGEYQRAEQLHQESLAICREVGERRGIALCLHNLGRLAYDMEDHPTAEQHLQESLARYKEIGHRPGVASTLCQLGYVVCALDSSRHQEASEYLNQALEIAVKIGAPPLILDILVGLATLLVADEPEDTEKERAIELLALALHHPASEQETKDKANRLLAEVTAKMPSKVMTTAQDRGKAKMLDTVVMEILEHKGFDWQNATVRDNF